MGAMRALKADQTDQLTPEFFNKFFEARPVTHPWIGP